MNRPRPGQQGGGSPVVPASGTASASRDEGAAVRTRIHLDRRLPRPSDFLVSALAPALEKADDAPNDDDGDDGEEDLRDRKAQRSSPRRR